MYHLSRSLYRELAALLPDDHEVDDRQRVLNACEATMTRLATDPDYFAHPDRFLYREVRTLFGLAVQRRVCTIITNRLAIARAKIEHERALMRRDCDAFTRSGGRCQREALEGTKYCSSHRHLDPKPVEPAAVVPAPALA
jgi:hypothetical protein